MTFPHRTVPAGSFIIGAPNGFCNGAPATCNSGLSVFKNELTGIFSVEPNTKPPRLLDKASLNLLSRWLLLCAIIPNGKHSKKAKKPANIKLDFFSISNKFSI